MPIEGAPRLVQPHETGSPLHEIYRRYCRYVAAVVLRLGGRDGDVEDLIQDVFVQAAGGLKNLRHPEAIKGWLATIAVRVSRRHLRRRRVRRFLHLDDKQEARYTQLAGAHASPIDRVFLAQLYRVLDELPVADRLAFALHHIEGEKLEMVARLCECSCATAKRRIARAHTEIKKRLGDA